MPFQSEKQRKYLWANEPEIAREWTDKYGSRVKKDNGGIMDSLSQSYGNVVGPHIQALYGPYGIAKTAPSSYDYHVLGTGDLTQRISDELKATGNPLSSAAFDYAAPGLAGALSIPYDALQAGVRTLYDKDWNFRGPLEGFDITDTMNPNYKSVPGFGTRWAQEKPLEAMIGRFTGAAQPLVNRWDKTGASLAKAWDAIKNEFGGSAEAADLSGMIPKNLEKTIEEGMQSYKKSNEISPALQKAIEEGTSYNEWDMIPNTKYHGIPMKQISLNQDEEETFIDPNRIPGRIQKSVPRKMGMLERFRNKFYKPAAGAVNYGGKTYSPAQLNSMNALGGYYSEPARQQRRLDARRTNILNRAAKGKPVGNVTQLLGPNYQGTPGGGISYTGPGPSASQKAAGATSRSDDSWSSSPFRRGGLASLWQR